jgi:hypothetical protein
MEPEFSLLSSQQLTLVSILSQIDSFHTNPSSLYDPFSISIHYVVVPLVVLFLLAQHQNPTCIPLLPIYATCPVHLILFDFIILIILGEVHKLRSSALCSFLSLHLSLVQTFSSGLCSHTPKVLMVVCYTKIHWVCGSWASSEILSNNTLFWKLDLPPSSGERRRRRHLLFESLGQSLRF